MVSYGFNLSMYPPKTAPNLPYSSSSAWYGNYHHPQGNQFLTDSDTPTQAMYHTYPHHMFQSSPDWTSHEHFSGPPTQTSILQTGGHGGPGSGPVHLSNQNGNSDHHLAEGISSLPSPPITVSGSEISTSPGAPNGAASPQITSRPVPAKSPFEWMKKPSYQSQPNPGKTRTKDKYRVVYSDHQRLELEKEFHTSKYITIRRKTELAQLLQLSERQVKIWFQNRRAKERKQTKKRDDPTMNSMSQHPSLMDVKPKVEGGFHPALHQMSAMSMGMGTMGLHHPHHPLHHSHLSVPTSQHLHQAAAAAAHHQVAPADWPSRSPTNNPWSYGRSG